MWGAVLLRQPRRQSGGQASVVTAAKGWVAPTA